MGRDSATSTAPRGPPLLATVEDGAEATEAAWQVACHGTALTRSELIALSSRVSAPVVQAARGFASADGVLAILSAAETMVHRANEARDWAAQAASISIEAARRQQSFDPMFPAAECRRRAHELVHAAGQFGQIQVDVDHALDGELVAVQLAPNRVLFRPSGDAMTTLRTQFFESGWHQRLREAGQAIMASTIGNLNRDEMDHLAAKQLARGRPIEPSNQQHYHRACEECADGLVRLHMAEASGDTWGPVPPSDVATALVPVFQWATERFLHFGSVLRIAPERVDSHALASICAMEREMVIGAMMRRGLSRASADAVVTSLTWSADTSKPWRTGLMGHPLVDLTSSTVAFMPSVVINAAWLKVRERDSAPTDGAGLGDARSGRLAERLATALRTKGLQHVFEDVAIARPDGKGPLTDLDVVAVTDDAKHVLVIQVKAFVTPTTAHSPAAVNHVCKATVQCVAAEENRPAVETAFKNRRLPLQAGWTLTQLIATDGIGWGWTRYPVVCAAWLERVAFPASADFADLHDTALRLPAVDAGSFAVLWNPVHHFVGGVHAWSVSPYLVPRRQ